MALVYIYRKMFSSLIIYEKLRLLWQKQEMHAAITPAAAAGQIAAKKPMNDA
jgi:uncharacterized protein (DUF2062 family)